MITKEEAIDNLISQLKDESKQIVDAMIVDTGFRFELEKPKEGMLLVRLRSDNHLGFDKDMAQEAFYYGDLRDVKTILNLFRNFDDKIKWYIAKNHSIGIKSTSLVGSVVKIELQIGELK